LQGLARHNVASKQKAPGNFSQPAKGMGWFSALERWVLSNDYLYYLLKGPASLVLIPIEIIGALLSNITLVEVSR